MSEKSYSINQPFDSGRIINAKDKDGNICKLIKTKLGVMDLTGNQVNLTNYVSWEYDKNTTSLDTTWVDNPTFPISIKTNSGLIQSPGSTGDTSYYIPNKELSKPYYIPKDELSGPGSSLIDNQRWFETCIKERINTILNHLMVLSNYGEDIPMELLEELKLLRSTTDFDLLKHLKYIQ